MLRINVELMVSGSPTEICKHSINLRHTLTIAQSINSFLWNASQCNTTQCTVCCHYNNDKETYSPVGATSYRLVMVCAIFWCL